MLILELRPSSWEIKTGEIPHCKAVQKTLPVFCAVQALVIGGYNLGLKKKTNKKKPVNIGDSYYRL